MAYKVRPLPFIYYRLFFVVMTFVVGLSGLCILASEQTDTVSLLVMVPGFEREAVVSTCGVMGVIGILAGLLMLHLMKDRRTLDNDRRQAVAPIDFADRRIADRRPESFAEDEDLTYE